MSANGKKAKGKYNRCLSLKKLHLLFPVACMPNFLTQSIYFLNVIIKKKKNFKEVSRAVVAHETTPFTVVVVTACVEYPF